MVYLLRFHVEVETDGDGGKHIVDVVGADEVGLHLVPFHPLRSPAELEEGSAGDYFSPYVAVLPLAVGDEAADVALLCHLHQMLVVGIDEDEGIVGGEEVVKLAFRLLHSLETAEALQVGTAHVGDHAAGRLHILHELADVIGMGSSHLHDGDLMLFAQAEECLGHAHVVVEVALGKHHVVFLAENGRYEFFGSGLAVGARDSYHRNVEVAAVLAGEFLEGGEAVVHEDVTPVALLGILLFVHNHIGAAFLQSHAGKLVAVKRGTLQGEEDAALGTIAAVGGNHRVLKVNLIEF